MNQGRSPWRNQLKPISHKKDNIVIQNRKLKVNQSIDIHPNTWPNLSIQDYAAPGHNWSNVTPNIKESKSSRYVGNGTHISKYNANVPNLKTKTL